MKDRYINQYLLVDDYLAGRLPEDELAKFEERLIWDEVLVEELALARAMSKAMKEQVLDEAMTISDEPGSDSPRERSYYRYAVAASVLLALSVSFNFVQGLDGFFGRNDDQQLASTQRVLRLVATRSPSAIEFELASDDTAVLTVEPADGFVEFRLTVAADTDPDVPVAQEAGLNASRGELLAIAVPASLLPNGDYVLSLDGSTAAQGNYSRISEIPFRIQRFP